MDGGGAATSSAWTPAEPGQAGHGWAAVLESRPSPLRPTAQGVEPQAVASPTSPQRVEPARSSPAVERGRREPVYHPPPTRRRQPGYSSLMSWQKLQLDVRKGAPLRRVAMAEVQQHCSVEDTWIILRGKVYSITDYCHYHPGGGDILCAAAGTDCTQLFDTHHRWVNGESLLKKWCEHLLQCVVPCTLFLRNSHVTPALMIFAYAIDIYVYNCDSFAFSFRQPHRSTGRRA